jgi:hypothetical protein
MKLLIDEKRTDILCSLVSLKTGVEKMESTTRSLSLVTVHYRKLERTIMRYVCLLSRVTVTVWRPITDRASYFQFIRWWH